MSRLTPHLERIRLFAPVRWRLAGGAAFMLVNVAMQLLFPRFAGTQIDHLDAFTRAGVPTQAALLAAAAAVVYSAAMAMRTYLFESSSYIVVAQLRRRLFGSIIAQPVGFFDRNNIGELSSRLTADVHTFNDSVTKGATYALQAVIVLIGTVAMLLSISPTLCLLLVVFLPANLLLGKVGGKQFRQRSQRLQSCLADSGKLAYEFFSHVRLVHSLNQQAGVLAKYSRAVSDLFAASLASGRLIAVFQGMASLLTLLVALVTLWFGGRLIAAGEMTIGTLTTFILYAGMAGDAVGSLSEFWNTWMRMIGATDRIFDMLRSTPPPSTGAAAGSLTGAVSLRDVDFCYPERPDVAALQGANVDIAAGEKVALVGASGAGKSTIASLILGHYGPSRGRVLFDGIDAASLDVASIRAQLAIVEQEPSLFSGTIAENLAFAVPERELARDELVAAAQLANAHDFISAFPHGYDTFVGERGVQLSGGQKQRLAIARAMLRNPKILILDEATSALDAASERLVQSALDRLMEGRTTLIIAHRFSTIVKTDRVLVLEGGFIRQQGRHAALLADEDGLYYRLMRHQLSQYHALNESLAAKPCESAASTG